MKFLTLLLPLLLSGCTSKNIISPLSQVSLPTQTILPSIPQKNTTIVATGDVMLGRTVHTQSLKYQDLNWPFLKTKDLLSSADITLINLETPLFDPCPNQDSGMIFCAPTNTVASLVNAGVDVANIANNHFFDQGTEGSASTTKTLETVGLKQSHDQSLAIVEKNGLKFGFLGFNTIRQTDQYQLPTNDFIKSKITSAKLQVDVLIVSFHWGNEYQSKPSAYQTQIGHLAIDTGADVVIGHHPHVIQSVEIYRDKPIFYSLGNFIFDQMWSEETRRGQVVTLEFNGSKIDQYTLTDLRIYDYGQPTTF